MKMVWEEKDVIVGTRYSRPGVSEAWMIGYVTKINEHQRRFVSISMHDGMVTEPIARKEMVSQLNACGYIREDLMPFCS